MQSSANCTDLKKYVHYNTLQTHKYLITQPFFFFQPEVVTEQLSHTFTPTHSQLTQHYKYYKYYLAACVACSL